MTTPLDRFCSIVTGSELGLEPELLVTVYGTGEITVATRYPGDRTWGPPAFGRPA